MLRVCDPHFLLKNALEPVLTSIKIRDNRILGTIVVGS